MKGRSDYSDAVRTIRRSRAGAHLGTYRLARVLVGLLGCRSLFCVECSAGRCVSSRFVEGRGASERRLHLQTFSRSCLPENECFRRFLRRRRRSERSLEGRKYAFPPAVHIYDLRSPAIPSVLSSAEWREWVLSVFPRTRSTPSRPTPIWPSFRRPVGSPLVQWCRVFGRLLVMAELVPRRSGPTRARYGSFVEEGEEGLWPQSWLVQTAGVEEAVSRRPRRVSPSFIQRPMLEARHVWSLVDCCRITAKSSRSWCRRVSGEDDPRKSAGWPQPRPRFQRLGAAASVPIPVVGVMLPALASGGGALSEARSRRFGKGVRSWASGVALLRAKPSSVPLLPTAV